MLRSSDSTASPLAPPPSHSAGKLPAAAEAGGQQKAAGWLSAARCGAHQWPLPSTRTFAWDLTSSTTS